jgi:hypothetical protein
MRLLSSASPFFRKSSLAVSIAAAMLISTLPVDVQSKAPTIRNAEDFLIVDCLLPGQMRKLGRVSTFMSARRPVRTNQADCEIRGGEYVAFDRANYQTALKVWLEQATAGDAEAQNYVGEIYHKGLGTEPDYAKAAEWYEKAAAQGSKRAQINLGSLYESGLGVGQDVNKALNLYRQGSGITGDDLIYASTMTSAMASKQGEIESLQRDVASQREAAERLKAENEKLKGELDQRRRALQSSQSELENARSQLKTAQTRIAPADADLAVLGEVLAAKEQELAMERERLERDRKAHAERMQRDRTKLAELKSREAQLSKAATAATGNSAELDKVRSDAAELALTLDGSLTRIEEMERALAENQKRQDAEQARYQADRKKMEAALSASKEDRELLLLLEQQLSEKQREVARQRGQIVALEQQASGLGGGSAMMAASSGPDIQLTQPSVTLSRGRAEAVIAAQSNAQEVSGQVTAAAGLRQLTVNGQAVKVASNGTFRVRVPVPSQGVDVKIVAVDSKGVERSRDFTIASATVANASGGAAAATSQRAPAGVKLGRYHALIIGNNEYGSYPKLASAINDAQRIGGVLKQRYGFQTTVLSNANRFEILSALNDMREKLAAEDNLLVYFAGHGEMDKGSQQGYWIPVDGKADAPNTWLSNRAVSDMLNTMAPRHVLVVADSCYSGTMTKAAVPVFAAQGGQQGWSRWVQAATSSRSRTALTSGGLAPVPDIGRGGNSHFAGALVAALEDNSQLLQGQRLFQEVFTSLASASAESDLVQIPEYAPIQFAGHEAGEFFFSPSGRGVASAEDDSAVAQR